MQMLIKENRQHCVCLFVLLYGMNLYFIQLYMFKTKYRENESFKGLVT